MKANVIIEENNKAKERVIAVVKKESPSVDEANASDFVTVKALAENLGMDRSR